MKKLTKGQRDARSILMFLAMVVLTVFAVLAKVNIPQITEKYSEIFAAVVVGGAALFMWQFSKNATRTVLESKKDLNDLYVWLDKDYKQMRQFTTVKIEKTKVLIAGDDMKDKDRNWETFVVTSPVRGEERFPRESKVMSYKNYLYEDFGPFRLVHVKDGDEYRLFIENGQVY